MSTKDLHYILSSLFRVKKKNISRSKSQNSSKRPKITFDLQYSICKLNFLKITLHCLGQGIYSSSKVKQRGELVFQMFRFILKDPKLPPSHMSPSSMLRQYMLEGPAGNYYANQVTLHEKCHVTFNCEVPGPLTVF